MFQTFVVFHDKTWYLFEMCVTRLLPASECGPAQAEPSLVSGNTLGLLYRVLREVLPRGNPRSVDRKCAGRNAKSVKGRSPDRQDILWWPSQYAEAKAVLESPRVPAGTVAMSLSGRIRQRRLSSTTGVHDHGMYTRSAAERERSARSRANVVRPRLRVSGQGVASESKTILVAEVRCSRSSEEVE